jgi:hypothetical protein
MAQLAKSAKEFRNYDAFYEELTQEFFPQPLNW